MIIPFSSRTSRLAWRAGAGGKTIETTDYAKPSHSPIYDPAAAAAFFEAEGKQELFSTGRVFFKERERRGFFSGNDCMYLLLDGAVAITLDGKPVDTVKPGEIFGEMASLTNSSRSATATAKSDCKVISLDGKQFQRSIQRDPGFALMLMSILINRLRLTLARLFMKKSPPTPRDADESRVFDDATLEKLSAMLDHPRLLSYSEKQIIINAGDAGTFLYIPLEGRVAISAEGQLLEYAGVGGVFGEMALVDNSTRAAKAVAATDCSLLAVNRKQFLELVQSNPDFGLSLLKLLAQRLQVTTTLASR